MILKDSFYQLIDLQKVDHGFICKIELADDHIIYTGHFPGFPVTPGVIQLEIVRELLMTFFHTEVVLNKIIESKFLQIIDPNKTKTLEFDIHIEEENPLKIKAIGKIDDLVFMKHRAVYTIQPTS